MLTDSPSCFAVPDICNENSDCPDIGKKCDGYLIPSFGCKNNKCEYGPVLTSHQLFNGAWNRNITEEYLIRFESCKCKKHGIFNKKLFDNITTSTTIEVIKPEETTTNPIDDTNETTTIHDYDFDYDLPDNFESNYTIFLTSRMKGPCENDINRKTNVRNQRFDKIPHYCLHGCQQACLLFQGMPKSGCFTVPDLCNTNSDCPDIGKNCSSYLIPSIGCKNGKCEYGPVLARSSRALRRTMDDKPYANRFEPCKCTRFNDKLTNNITTTTIEDITPEDTTTNLIDETASLHGPNYDLPNNFEAIYTMGQCKNNIQVNSLMNVRNHIGKIHWNRCDFNCNEPGCSITTIEKNAARNEFFNCFIVPDNCKANKDCPDIGKNCNGYLIPSWGCQNGTCEYGDVVTRKGATMHRYKGATIDNKPIAKRFEPCKCDRLGNKLTNKDWKG